MHNYVEEIKSRMDVVDLVSQYVQLKKAGRNFKGLCPFHAENSPSFVVSPEKQIYHCFGCNKGGDLFNFVEDIEGISFTEALDFLASKCGITIERKKLKNSKKNADLREQFLLAHKLAAQFFSKNLFESEDGKKVLDYLYKRGLNDEAIKEFQLGFAPDSSTKLHHFLLEKNISKEVLVKSGLVSSKGIADSEMYDKYRGRLIFPIFDQLGRIIAFGGRALKSGQMPKYLNSPENLVYNKSSILYGFSHAKQQIKKDDFIVLVEGYFDMILPFQVGVKNIAATCGTALTEKHAKQISRLTKNVICCFDADSAGFEASKRAYNILRSLGIKVKIFSDFEGKDPADYVRDKGKFVDLAESAEDFLIYLMERSAEGLDLDKKDDVDKFVELVMPFMLNLSPLEKDFYVRKLALKLSLEPRKVYDQIEFFAKNQNSSNYNFGNPKEEKKEKTAKFSLEHLLFGIFWVYPAVFAKYYDKLDDDILKSWPESFNSVYNRMISDYNSRRDDFVTWTFTSDLDEETKKDLKMLSFFIEERYQKFPEDKLIEALEEVIRSIKSNQITRSLKKIRGLIKIAERENDRENLIKYLQKQKVEQQKKQQLQEQTIEL